MSPEYQPWTRKFVQRSIAVALELLVPGVLPDQAHEPAVEILGNEGVIPLPNLALQVGPGRPRQGTDLGFGSGRPVPVRSVCRNRTMHGDAVVLAEDVEELFQLADDGGQKRVGKALLAQCPAGLA